MEKENATAEALELSLKYNFVTPLTSMVVTKPESDDSLIADKLTEGATEQSVSQTNCSIYLEFRFQPWPYELLHKRTIKYKVLVCVYATHSFLCTDSQSNVEKFKVLVRLYTATRCSCYFFHVFMSKKFYCIKRYFTFTFKGLVCVFIWMNTLALAGYTKKQSVGLT